MGLTSINTRVVKRLTELLCILQNFLILIFMTVLMFYTLRKTA